MNIGEDAGSGIGPDKLDALVIGAGFAGLYMLHSLRQLGMTSLVLEAADDVGGTWQHNRYPGLRCDVESMLYCYSFSEELDREWTWTERYPAQPEILRYLRHVADRFELRRDIRLNTRVTEAAFNDAGNDWTVVTSEGDCFVAKYLVMATGCLSVPTLPRFAGLNTFRGDWYHTARWPEQGVDFSGKRVGVVGTGSSGIQCIPVIAQQAEHLTVFQRTPAFVVPARNAPLDEQFVQSIKANYAFHRGRQRNAEIIGGGDLALAGDARIPPGESALSLRPEERDALMERRWAQGGAQFAVTFPDALVDPQVNEIAAEFVRKKIREAVRDEAVAKILSPRSYPFATKRLCVGTDYYETYNRENVELVDAKANAIVEITSEGIRTQVKNHQLDAIVFATGYDAMTGALLNIRITGSGGRRLSDDWSHGPQSYLGISVSGYPNMFLITGPGSPSVISNVVMSIEQHVEFIAGILEDLRDAGVERFEASEEAQAGWAAHVREVAGRTLLVKSNSWYVGANIPGKPRVFMVYVGGVHVYRRVCERVRKRGYTGFLLDGRSRAPARETASDYAGESM
ncbi:NAD(P)/FAD-dependent oxidoreductase [Sphingobium sp.]|uniref:flavin-containing monooxygenase n=1 Tax=Sphingobium sp. TaxID=1912891 RepID=UPI0028BE7615|nr:NAD(P)/FAD-dependent oxidoreductase [Sphingobium sp.]